MQSRYYDPVTHRFINADSYQSTGQGVLGTNMFAYCNNVPVILIDSRGTHPIDRRELYALSVRIDPPKNKAVDHIIFAATEEQAATFAGIIMNDLSATNKIEYICGI